MGSDTDWSDVEGGRYNCLAIKTDGTLWSWGLNTDVPMVGDSTSINRSSPVQIGALTNWLKLSAGAGSYKVAAIKTDGTLWGWGRDIFGEIGLNVTGNKNSPNQVGALTTWLEVASGAYSTVATQTDGTLWCWGQGAGGQPGQNNTINKSSPTQVGTDTDWAKTGATKEANFAIKNSGTLWGWGNGSQGRLGQDSQISYSSPVQLGSSVWQEVAGGSAHTSGITKG